MGSFYPNKTRFSKKAFLEYHDFEDECELLPLVFLKDKSSYEQLIVDVRNDIKVGVKLDDAIRLNAGVDVTTVFKWKKAFLKEIKDGKTDTALIRLFGPAYKADAQLYHKVMKLAMKKAEEGDVSTIQYLAKHRLGYNSSNKQEIELSSSDEAPVRFVFADMTPVETDQEKEDDD